MVEDTAIVLVERILLEPHGDHVKVYVYIHTPDANFELTEGWRMKVYPPYKSFPEILAMLSPDDMVAWEECVPAGFQQLT